MIDLTINGVQVSVPEGTTVLRAAESAGITIPTLCDHPDLTPFGGCRLCLVEVKGARSAATACTLQATQGMEVQTETPTLIQSRRWILQMLLSSTYDAGYKQDGEESQFMHWVHHYQVSPEKYMAKAPKYAIDSDANPFLWVDKNKCIDCTRCVRACNEIQGRHVWGMFGRGADTQPVPGANLPLLEARCESCGACVAYCPTGALDYKMSIGMLPADKKVTTTCTYCGVGCQFDLNVRDNRVVRVTSNPDAPVNGMHLCVKGRFGYDFIHHPDRLQRPKVRKYLLEGAPKPRDRGEWVEVDWDTALGIAAGKLLSTRDTWGPDSIGVLTSAKCTNEENYLMNKLARQVIGTNSIDHCARL
jgi:formate dehydrogenase major subunit/formate dehydrogenase alpha subunit